MEYLVWAWRVYFDQISIYDVPVMIRSTCIKIIDELRVQDTPKL